MKILLRLIIASFIFSGFLSSCKKDKLLTDSGVSLLFSEDTIRFDTVFTSVGSATQVFTVHNTYDQPLNIGTINLQGGSASFYRLNVNGTPGKSFTDVEIGANDSIWVFVEVTIDPNNGTTPLIVEDAILFNTNGHMQQMPLVAYGQDAHFYPSSNCGEQVSQCTPLFKLKDCAGGSMNLHWTNDKPYVIYGYAILDSGYTLTIDAGVRVHFHNNSGLIVLNTAKLFVNGVEPDPVTFQGSRLGVQYQDVPGQWDRIWFSSITSLNISVCPVEVTAGAGGFGNKINYAIIKNGFVGIQADTSGHATEETVEINNTILKNFASTAFYGNGAFVSANNTVFANSGEFLAYLPIGGFYRFLHCTFANYWTTSNRSTPSVLFNNYYVDLDNILRIRPITAYFGNCIIYGNQETEIGFDTITTGNYVTLIVEKCVYKIDNDTYNGSSGYYINSIRNSDPVFKNIEQNNYRIEDSTASSALNTGLIDITNINPILSTDLDGKQRPAPGNQNPDIGAYEADLQ